MSGSDSRAASERLGVVTVAYRSEQVLPAFLASIPQASTLPIMTVVVDNLPAEGRAHALAEHATASYLPMAANLGYGGAMNAGVAALPEDIEWVLISNPDVVLSPGVLDSLLAVGKESEDIASIGPALGNGDGSLYPSARAVPSIRTGIGHAMFTNLWPTNPWTRRYRNDALVAERRDAGWLSGACVLVRRSAFDELGGFDTGFFMYFEDVDLGYRFGQLGYRNVYDPSVRVVHTGAHSTNSDSALMIAAHHASARRFLSKKYSGWWLWPVRTTLGLGLHVRSVIIGRRLTRQGENS